MSHEHFREIGLFSTYDEYKADVIAAGGTMPGEMETFIVLDSWGKRTPQQCATMIRAFQKQKEKISCANSSPE